MRGASVVPPPRRAGPQQLDRQIRTIRKLGMQCGGTPLLGMEVELQLRLSAVEDATHRPAARYTVEGGPLAYPVTSGPIDRYQPDPPGHMVLGAGQADR